MSIHRRNAKRDAVEAEVIEMLEVCGWRVLRISVKDGPDLMASRPWNCYRCAAGRTLAIEVKTGKKKLRDGQQRWFDNWPGEKAVLRTAEDVKDL